MPLGGKQNDTVLGRGTVSGGQYSAFYSIRIKTGERMVSRYSGGHGIRGPVFVVLQSFFEIIALQQL